MSKQRCRRNAKNIFTSHSTECPDIVSENAGATEVRLPSDDWRKVGLSWRPISAIFESLTGDWLIIDDTPEAVVVAVLTHSPSNCEVIWKPAKTHGFIRSYWNKWWTSGARLTRKSENGEQATLWCGDSFSPSWDLIKTWSSILTSYGQNVFEPQYWSCQTCYDGLRAEDVALSQTGLLCMILVRHLTMRLKAQEIGQRLPRNTTSQKWYECYCFPTMAHWPNFDHCKPW